MKSAEVNVTQAERRLTLCQVALCGRKGLAELEPWYVGALGFRPVGGAHFSGPELIGFTGMDVPAIDVEVGWFVGRDGFQQVEYFHFAEPESRPKRADWTPADIGYVVVGIHVLDFDGTIERLAALGSVPLGAIVGGAGDRRASLLDPNGNLVELMERDIQGSAKEDPARPDANPAVRFVRASVGDLDRSRRFFVDALGLRPAAVDLHGGEHEAGWGLEGARVELEVLEAGGCFVELAQYGDGVRRDRPEDHRLSDEGILNLACGSGDPEPVRLARKRLLNGPYAVHDDERSAELECNYVTDDQGFSVELLYMGASRRAEYGFI